MSKDSSNNKGQGVKTGPKVSIDKYSDSSNNRNQRVKSGSSSKGYK